MIRKNTEHFDDVEIIPFAITDSDGKTIRLFVDTESQENNTLDPSLLSGRNSITEIDVKTLRLDTFVQERRISKIDVLKVDIQGSESLLLKGGAVALKQTELAFFEIWLRTQDVFEMVDIIRKELPHFRALNHVMHGADMCFSRMEIAKYPESLTKL